MGSDFDLDEAAREFAENVHDIAEGSGNEEELRIDMEEAIGNLADTIELSVDPKRERTLVSGGRYDSVYGDLVIEYKDPTRTDNWQEEAVEGRNENDNGLIDYMYKIAEERAHNDEERRAILDRMIGVGTNGYKIFFCRYQPEKKTEVIPSKQSTLISNFSRDQVADGVEIVNSYPIHDGARRFVTYLRSLQRKPLTSEEIASSFGPSSPLARNTVTMLYDELQESRGTHGRITMLYGEWERMFGIVYGDELDQISEDREEFGSVYGVDSPEVRPFLFSVHTYYALLMKILVKELTASVAETPISESDLYDPDDERLKRKLQELESGREFETVGLENFFEEGFFAWYLDTWNEGLAEQVRSINEELQDFEPATPTIKPEAVRDILKDLYQELVPRVIRHDLGEYLTPDWLAEYTINQTDFEVSEDGRMLDPTCGSGTFLIEGIRRIRKTSDIEGEILLEDILNRVVGFDLNPISVIASRTNYLMGLGELAFVGDNPISIPVFQCDSILTPSKYIDASNGFQEAYRIPTIEGEFRIPALSEEDSRQKKHEKINGLFHLIETYVEMDASTDEFLKVFGQESSIPNKYESLVRDLYSDIKELNEKNRDGVWIQLLRNRVAPEFSGDFEYVIGNPPWVDWANLSAGYREITEDVWAEYELFEFSGYDARTVHDDICILMTYVAMDEYLSDSGQLNFLLPQGLFQTHQGGHGFRRFSIPKTGKSGKRVYTPLRVEQVDDLSAFDPFDASNRTSMVKIRKGEETDYPVPYRIWDPKSPIRFSDTLEDVLEKVEFKNVGAEPVSDDPRSEWLTLKPKAIKALKNVIGESEYRAREGINTLGADGIYYIDLLEDRGDTFLIKNLPGEGNKRSISKRGSFKREVEKEIIYPAVKGRNIHGWDYDVELHLLVPHENKRGPHNGISESDMRTKYRNAYQYFQNWEDILRESREQNGKFYDPDKDPFYLFDNVGEYSFAPYKAVWQRKSGNITATVLEHTDAGLGIKKPVMNYDTVMSVGVDDRDEAHYICAVMNSSFTRLVTQGYTNVLAGLSSHVLENVGVPTYDSNATAHKKLAELSKKAHASDTEEIDKIEKEIDEQARLIWGITEEELEEVQRSLDEIV